MKKLMLVLVLLLGTLSFVACGKKKDEGGNQCQGYPAGYVRVTDQRMLQLIGTGGSNYGGGYYGGYNGGYNQQQQYGYNQQPQYGYNQQQQYGYNQQQTNAICVDQNRYQQLLAQVNGNQNNQYNCQQYPSAPGCSGGGNYGGGYGGNSDPYCDYYPEDQYCWGSRYY